MWKIVPWRGVGKFIWIVGGAVSIVITVTVVLVMDVPTFTNGFSSGTSLATRRGIFTRIVFSNLGTNGGATSALTGCMNDGLSCGTSIASPSAVTSSISITLRTTGTGLTTPVASRGILGAVVLGLCTAVANHCRTTGNRNSSGVNPNNDNDGILSGLFPSFSGNSFDSLFGNFSSSFSRVNKTVSNLLDNLNVNNNSNGGARAAAGGTSAAGSDSSGSSATSVPGANSITVCTITNITMTTNLTLMLAGGDGSSSRGWTRTWGMAFLGPRSHGES